MGYAPNALTAFSHLTDFCRQEDSCWIKIGMTLTSVGKRKRLLIRSAKITIVDILREHAPSADPESFLRGGPIFF